MGTAKKASAREKKPAAVKATQTSPQQNHTLSLTREANDLLVAICQREGFDPEEFLHQLVMAGLEKYRLPFTERPDISRIMKLIHSYRSPLELRLEHWRYQDQFSHPAIEDAKVDAGLKLDSGLGDAVGLPHTELEPRA